MDWNDLRHFLAVARAGTLTGAARLLDVEHTTVSRRVAALEQAVGAKLFTRGADGLQLTATGREILTEAESVERSIHAIERRASAEQRIEGLVRVTTSEAMGALLVRRLGELRAQHPELVVEVLTGNQLLDLMRGEADIAVRMAVTTQPELVSRKLGTFEWALFAARALADQLALTSARDLDGRDVIGYDASLDHAPGPKWLVQHGAGARVVMRVSSINAALSACIAGIGIALLPTIVAAPEPSLCRLAAEPIGTRDVFLVHHPDTGKSARVRAVLDFILGVFRDLSAVP